MKILVTGCAGFIGFHATQRLLEQGNKVTGIDNLTDYYSTDLKKRRLAKLTEFANFSFINLDISERSELAEVVSKKNFQVIVHLAAQPGVRVKFSESERYSKSNLLGFGNVLQCAVEFDVPTFLYASSSSVYGNSKVVPFSETKTVVQPINYYGGTKLANEILVSSSVHNTNTKAIAMRFFTVYGNWGRPDMAYFKILSRNLADTKFELFGDGLALRDFTHIDDVTESISRLIDYSQKKQIEKSLVVNIGGGKPRSMSNLIEIMNMLTGYIQPTFNTSRDPLDMEVTAADTTRLFELISFAPAIELEEGLEKFVKWAMQDEIRSQLRFWIS